MEELKASLMILSSVTVVDIGPASSSDDSLFLTIATVLVVFCVKGQLE